MIKLWRSVAVPVLLGFVLLGAYLYFYLGASRDVQISIVDLPPIHLIFKEHRGPYHQINPVIVSVEEWAKKNGVSCTETFGEYLDDPQVVDEDRLRSRAGCLSRRPLAPILPPEIKLESRPPGRYIQARFSGSPAIGPWVVYPKIKAFVAEKGVSVSTSTIEVYTVHPDGHMDTEYLIAISGP